MVFNFPDMGFALLIPFCRRESRWDLGDLSPGGRDGKAGGAKGKECVTPELLEQE